METTGRTFVITLASPCPAPLNATDLPTHMTILNPAACGMVWGMLGAMAKEGMIVTSDNGAHNGNGWDRRLGEDY
jgi:hypothetical protein